MSKHERRFAWDIAYAVDMAVACLITYWVLTNLLSRLVDVPNDLLGGMWGVVATVFVFRDTRAHSLPSGIARMIATCVSFALCFLYLWFFAFTPVGMAALIGIGTVTMMLLGRRDDIVITGITTAVVMVAAAIGPQDAWMQPVLRLVDTVVGITVGVACKWIASYAFYRTAGEPVR
jgi:uncharacterized membrane protein YgaE (UPF0421/DUF939 family)